VRSERENHVPQGNSRAILFISQENFPTCDPLASEWRASATLEISHKKVRLTGDRLAFDCAQSVAIRLLLDLLQPIWVNYNL
jgi:hypothetical protein